MFSKTAFTLREIGKIGLRRTLKLDIGTQTSFMPLKRFSTTTSWNQMDHSKGTDRFLNMDSPILQDILGSNLPEELKCLNLASATKDLEYITAADCYGLFKVYVQWVLHFDEESKVWRPAFDSLEFLAQSAPMLFTQYVRPNLVNDIVMYYPNVNGALELCEWLFIIQWRVELTEKYKDTTRKNEEKYKYANKRIAKLENEMEMFKEAVKKKKAEQKNMRYLAYVGESKVLVPCGHIVPVDATDISHRLCPICKALSYHSLKSNFPYDPLLPLS